MSVAASPRAAIAATLVFVGAVALVAAQVPPWCTALAMACGIWRMLIALGSVRAPRYRTGARFVFGALTALVVGAVLLRFRTFNGLEAGTALLTVMGAMKLLESRTQRDDAIVIGVSLFMLLAACLGSQALWRMPLYLLLVWGALVALAFTAHAGAALSARAAMRLATRALAMALPLAIACFLFFPRFAGQFWALQRGSTATTGLNDEMSPGSIDKLIVEYDPAFRVQFEGALPAPSQRYWRGPVLNTFDGFTWRRGRANHYVAAPVEMLGEPVRYQVTLEPSNQRWLFALETVARNPRYNFFFSHDRQLSVMDPITSVMAYQAVSHLRARSTAPLSKLGRRYETMLPPNRNPRTLELGRRMRAGAGSDAAFARAALDYFRDSGLEYTLQPEPTGIDSVDSVLFDTKLGFCGHFASAFATLMRAGGVPARVVTGYLGGEWNPIGGYLIVRQSDAHAWTEIWLDGAGWTRMDPTGVVEPARLQRGLYEVLPQAASGTDRFIYNSTVLSEASRILDSVNTWWNNRVLQFDLRAQLDFLGRLGFDRPGWQQLAWGFAAALLLWIAWISLALRRSVPRTRPDRLARIWLRATRKLARVAAPRAQHEGPVAYAERLAASHPALAAEVRDIASRYATLRFGDAANEAVAQTRLLELERRVRKMNPGRA